MRKVTIKDVARSAGVSIAAVSYVINGKHHKVSQDTIDKIRESIRELNYIPNMSARGLVKNTSQLIGVIIPQTEHRRQLVFENPFYSEMVSAIEATVREEGYHIILAGVEKDKTSLDIAISRNLDGAIVMGIYSEQLYEECKRANIPIVLIDSYINDDYFTKVGIDDEHGGYLATKYLIDCGHRNIALVTGMIRKDGVVEKRFLGYKRALQESGLFYNPEFVFEESVSYDHGLETGRRVAEKHPNITGIFATADMVALGVIRGIKEAGKEVPGDISVLGFDDISLASMFFPPLTTVNQKISLKGQTAAKLLIDQIKGRGHDRKRHSDPEIALQVIERQTVRRLNV